MPDMRPMTPSDLAAIRERCQKATRGPWFFGRGADNCDYIDYQAYPDERGGIAPTSNDDGREPIWWKTCYRDEDGQFIAHSRTDVEALLAEVERLRKLAQQSVADGWNAGVRSCVRAIEKRLPAYTGGTYGVLKMLIMELDGLEAK